MLVHCRICLVSMQNNVLFYVATRDNNKPVPIIEDILDVIEGCWMCGLEGEILSHVLISSLRQDPMLHCL